MDRRTFLKGAAAATTAVAAGVGVVAEVAASAPTQLASTAFVVDAPARLITHRDIIDFLRSFVNTVGADELRKNPEGVKARLQAEMTARAPISLGYSVGLTERSAYITCFATPSEKCLIFSASPPDPAQAPGYLGYHTSHPLLDEKTGVVITEPDGTALAMMRS